MKKRVAGIIIKDNKILLIHRLKSGEEFYVLPGGTMKDNESEEGVLVREFHEETNLNILEFEKFAEINDDSREHVIFLIKDYTGDVALGGEEKERMNVKNQYYLEWIDKNNFQSMLFYPKEIKKLILNKVLP